jgi:hypothetical protein
MPITRPTAVFPLDAKVYALPFQYNNAPSQFDGGLPVNGNDTTPSRTTSTCVPAGAFV